MDSMDDKTREKVRKALYKRFRSIGDATRRDGKRVIYTAPEFELHVLDDLPENELLRLEERYLKCFPGYSR